MIDQKPSSVDGPIVELRGVAKSYGAVRALHDGDIALRAGEVRALMGENGAGKSTLVKVLGGVVRRDDGEMLVDGAAADFHSPHDARDAGHRGDLPGADALPRPQRRGERRHGLPPARLAAADRPRRDAAHGAGPARPARRAARPRAPRPRPLDRRPADRRDRQGAQLRRPRPDHGRADRRALRPRGRAAVRGRPRAARGGRGDPLHLAPARRGVRDLRHRHGDARRRRRARRADRGHDAGRDGAADGRARAERALPEAGHAGRRHGAERPAAHARGRVHRRELRGPRRRGRRARRAGRRRAQRGGARDLRDRQARRRPRRGRRQAARRRPPARGDARRDRLRARGPPPAGPRDGPLDRPQRDDDPHRQARALRADPARRRERARARVGRPGCSCASTGSTTPRASSPAATSRRSCSRSGSPPSRGC